MTFETDAIYEGGVLRPLIPLQLKEHEVVSVSISTSDSAGLNTEVHCQRQILLAFVKKMEATPSSGAKDGLSNRDHDKLIYGN